MEGRRRSQLSSAWFKEQAISAPSKSGFSHSCRKAAGQRTGTSWAGICSSPKPGETFRSPLVPTIPWLLPQLWVSMGAAPVTPVPCENLGVFWEKGGNYLGRTVASLLNLAPQPFPGVNMEIRVNKTHGGKMYDSNLH